MKSHQLESAKDYRLEKLQGSDLYLAATDLSFRKLTDLESRRASHAQSQGS